MLFTRKRGLKPVDVAAGGSRLADSPAPAAGGAPTLAFPPTLYPPRGSTPIFKSATVSMLAVAGNTQSPAGLQFQLGAGRAGVLRVLSPFVDTPTATTDITWRILVNDRAPPGLSGLTIIGRAAASIEKIFDQFVIELPQRARVSVTIINNDGGAAYRVGMQLEGWDFPAGLVY